MSKKENVTKILDGIEKGLKNKFEFIREQTFNPNTKGGEFEKILKRFFESYLSGLLDFHVRVSLIDTELDAFTVFSSGENEFDVVATFKTTVPKIVLELESTAFLPYDSVAFVTEVKQELSKTALENDLKKLEKLTKLKTSEKRFGVLITGNYTIKRPLRILFYYESRIAQETMYELLVNYMNAWDFVIILKDNMLLGNSCIPSIGKRFDTEKPMSFDRYVLLFLMLLTSQSLPCPPIVSTWSLFAKMMGTVWSSE